MNTQSRTKAAKPTAPPPKKPVETAPPPPEEDEEGGGELFGDKAVASVVPQIWKPLTEYQQEFGWEIQDVPWERLLWQPWKPNPNVKGSYYSNYRLANSPQGSRLKIRLTKVRSPWGFGPGFDNNLNKWYYAWNLTQDSPAHKRTVRGDVFCKPALRKRLGELKGVKPNEVIYNPMIKDGKESEDGSEKFEPLMKVLVPLNAAGIPDSIEFKKDGVKMKPEEWEDFKKGKQHARHSVDVFLELKSAWFTSGKCGVKFDIQSLRLYTQSTSRGQFPDEKGAVEQSIPDAPAAPPVVPEPAAESKSSDEEKPASHKRKATEEAGDVPQSKTMRVNDEPLPPVVS